MQTLSVGIDVGGTFTDIVLHDPSADALKVVKVSTTPDDVSRGIAEAMAKFSGRSRDVKLISHASTTATNALLTHVGLAKVALVTNSGFRDIVEIARQRRPELYSLRTRRPAPLVRRRDRFVVRCRMLADGRELEPLSAADARRVARRLVKGGYQAVAVSFLNSHRNPRHEEDMRRWLLEEGFDGHVSLSSEVDREYREYERTSTTVVNAALSPLVSSYLASLTVRLFQAGFDAPTYVMNSDGGTSTLAYASRFPVRAIESGPAAGVLASRGLALALSLNRVLTFDMGGTTAKAGAILDGEAEISYEFEAAGKSHSGRSIRGSGYAVRAPFIDIAEVSSGGGTMAWVDEGGGLRIGPESAGSVPGPAAYGRGGKAATVTDANVVLGRVNPKYILGGEMKVRSDLAEEAIRRVARRLRLSVDEAAAGIVRLANSSMAKAMSIVSVERGRDPREFVMVAFGGAGPIHCCDIAEELGVTKAVVPVHAGLFSAYGLLAADIARTFSTPILSTSPSLGDSFRALAAEAGRSLRDEGFENYRLYEYLDLRYRGQSYELTIPYASSEDFRDSFAARHREVYGYDSADEVEVVNAKVRAVASTSTARVRPEKVEGPEASGPNDLREAWAGGRRAPTPVFKREELPTGSHGAGPCVLEEYDSTLVVNPGWRWSAQSYGTELWKWSGARG